MITVDMIDAIEVQFLKPIFEDDFPERGMKAWLTAIEWKPNSECYKLFFDFGEHEAHNRKYFRETYYPNRHTAAAGLEANGRTKFTAIEAGVYSPKYSVYFNTEAARDKRDDEAFAKEITDYLRDVKEYESHS